MMKTVILTGATGGLGNCLVKEILKYCEVELICSFRDEKKFNGLFHSCSEKIIPYKITYGEDYKYISKKIGQDSQEVILILNAFSISPLKSVGTYDPNEIERMLDINIKQNVYLLNEVISFCRSKGKGIRIINLDSGAADFPLKGWGNYCASKAYLNALLGVIVLEDPKCKAVSVDPGVMDTDMQKEIRNTDQSIFNKVEEFKKYKTDGLLRSPSHVAKYIVERYINNWKVETIREKIRS